MCALEHEKTILEVKQHVWKIEAPPKKQFDEYKPDHSKAKRLAGVCLRLEFVMQPFPEAHNNHKLDILDRRISLCSPCNLPARTYSEMMRSAHSTRDTKVAGLPNFAFQFARSFSVTPRAREQAPQAKTGICLETTFSRNSLSGGQPMGITASNVALRIR